MDRNQRQALQRRLARHYPWVAGTSLGPAAVEAGECEACGLEARLVAACGPGPQYLGRRCVLERGAGAWCDGHAADAAAAIAWARDLPAEADAVARWWWVTTGEVRPPRDPGRLPLPPALHAGDGADLR